MKEELKKFIKKPIVVDTRSAWIYIGTLEKVLEGSIVLSHVDVHDSRETRTSKEEYVLESRVSGIKANRDSVYINLDYLVSFSALTDVIKF